MENLEFSKGQVIFRQGSYAACMYDILQGKVGIYAEGSDGREKELTVLESGAYFGEMGMLECSPRSATAVALENGTRVQVITADTFSAYFQDHTEDVYAIMRHMSQRIRSLTEDYMDVCRVVAESAQGGVSGRGGLIQKLKKMESTYTKVMTAAAEYGGATELWRW